MAAVLAKGDQVAVADGSSPPSAGCISTPTGADRPDSALPEAGLQDWVQDLDLVPLVSAESEPTAASSQEDDGDHHDAVRPLPPCWDPSMRRQDTWVVRTEDSLSHLDSLGIGLKERKAFDISALDWTDLYREDTVYHDPEPDPSQEHEGPGSPLQPTQNSVPMSKPSTLWSKLTKSTLTVARFGGLTPTPASISRPYPYPCLHP